MRAKSAKFSENLNLFNLSFQLSRTTSPATSLILGLPTTVNSRYFRVPPSKSEPYRHSFSVRTIIDWDHLEDDIVDAPSTEAFRERLAIIQPDYLHNLISVQSRGRTSSSSLVTLARLPVSSSLGLQITNRSFTYASPYLWNQLPSSLRQPHYVHSPPASPHPAHHLISVTSLALILSLPRPFTPDLKLISFTKPFLHSQ